LIVQLRLPVLSRASEGEALDNRPDEAEVDAEVRVGQAVAHAGILLPRDLGAMLPRLVGELLDRFADDFEYADDRILRIRSAMNASRPTAAYELMSSMASRMCSR
jgi:hypothetical protein